MADLPPEEPPTLPPEKARQGRRGWQVLLVLVSALVLAMIIWGFVEIYGWTIRPSPEEQVGDPSTVEENTTGGITMPGPAEQ
jgi:hypothetical protein